MSKFNLDKPVFSLNNRIFISETLGVNSLFLLFFINHGILKFLILSRIFKKQLYFNQDCIDCNASIFMNTYLSIGVALN